MYEMEPDATLRSNHVESPADERRALYAVDCASRLVILFAFTVTIDPCSIRPETTFRTISTTVVCQEYKPIFAVPRVWRKETQRGVKFTSIRRRINPLGGSRVPAQGVRRSPERPEYQALRFMGNQRVIVRQYGQIQRLDDHTDGHTHAADSRLTAHDFGIHRKCG